MTDANAELSALGDPTRRSVFELVAARPRSVSEITRELPISQSAVSQHLRILKDARLVTLSTIGRRNIYRLDPVGIERMRTWLDGMWSTVLTAFAAHINNAEDKP